MGKRTVKDKVGMLQLYETWWKLHRVRIPDITCDFISAQKSIRQRLAVEMQELFKGHSSEYGSDDDERSGSLHECTWKLLMCEDDGEQSANEAPGSRKRPESIGQIISLVYERVVHKFVLLHLNYPRSRPLSKYTLLLSHAPASITKRFIEFAEDSCYAQIYPLKLPSLLLEGQMQTYLECLFRGTMDDPSDMPSTSFVNAVRGLKIGVAFAASVSPDLKRLDIDVPADTACALANASISTGETFLALLSNHLHKHTGMQLFSHYAPAPEYYDHPVIKIFRMMCASFALSADGRFNLSRKVLDAAGDHRSLLWDLNVGLLIAIAGEAWLESTID